MARRCLNVAADRTRGAWPQNRGALPTGRADIFELGGRPGNGRILEAKETLTDHKVCGDAGVLDCDDWTLMDFPDSDGQSSRASSCCWRIRTTVVASFDMVSPTTDLN